MIILDDNIHLALEKIAEEKRRYGTKDTWLAMKGVMGRKKKDGSRGWIGSKEDIKRRAKAGGKGALVGGVPAALLGAAGGAGLARSLNKRQAVQLSKNLIRVYPRLSPLRAAAIGAGIAGYTGAGAGYSVGMTKSDMKRLREAGVDSKWHGLSSEMTPSTYRRLTGKKKTASVARAQSLAKKYWSDLSGKTLKAAKKGAKETLRKGDGSLQGALGAKAKADKEISEAAKRQLRARLLAGGAGAAGIGGGAYALKDKKR